MSRSTIAGVAFLAGIAAASVLWPVPDSRAQTAQPGASPQGPSVMHGMMEAMPGQQGGTGPMGEMAGGWMRQRMMQRMGQMTPAQRCEERLARRAGMIAYTVAKLNLTPEQRPLWEKVRTIMQTAADRQHQLCAGLKAAGEQGQQTILDRMNRREQFLSARLDAVRQIRPAVEQLYQALTPEQKATIDHPFRRQ